MKKVWLKNGVCGMLANSLELVMEARKKGVAVAAFNTYNLETTRAMVRAAEKLQQPIMLQLGVPALKAGGEPYVAATIAAARAATVPISVHLDHCPDLEIIHQCFEWGVSSALADGSHLTFEGNVAFTRRAVEIASQFNGSIEAELGRLMGTEDGITVAELEASLTDPTLARQFVEETGAALLAVSIGNIHGYAPNPPALDFDRLEKIAAQVPVPLVLHGASGLAEADIRRAIRAGVAKLNVNTEVRVAFLIAIAEWGIRVGPDPDPRRKGQDLLNVLQEAIQAAETVCLEKIRAFSTI